MLQVGIFGGTGRVGKLLIEELEHTENIALASVYVRGDSVKLHNISSEIPVTSSMETFFEKSQVVIDFSSADATQELLEYAKQHPLPLVIGTTGLSDIQMRLLQENSKHMPILYATNMSEGVAILNKIVAMVSMKLRDYDIELTEIHHKYKKDAPSGTALTLAYTALGARGLSSQCLKFGREGMGERQKDEIGVFSMRGGDVVGRHTVGFYGSGEYLEFTHNATSRATFAKGALRAASWIVKCSNGLYGMQDIFEF